MEIPPIAAPTGAGTASAARPRDAEAQKAAQAFEAAFLSEMLKYTGLNAKPDGFGGGAGEEAFASLLTDEYAKLLAERGGIGLAEQIFEVLKQRTRDA
jgi:peptidoglycan hydrolase FlgJ